MIQLKALRGLTLAIAGFSVSLLTSCETFSPDLPPVADLRADEDKIVSEETVVVLVRTQTAASQLVINAARRDYQLLKKNDLDGLDFVILTFQRPPGVSGEVAIQDMERASPGATAGLEHQYTLQGKAATKNAPRSGANQEASVQSRGKPVFDGGPRLYASSMVGWPENGCRAYTAIGMIDGHVDVNAPMLKDADIVTRDFSNGALLDTDHGTAIADLLVGQGRLKNARLYAASVVSGGTRSSRQGAGVAAIIQALDWLQKSDVKLVNISLAGPYNKLLDRAIQSATAKGMTIIAAVGNDGPSANPRYPAAFDSVLAVTAIDSKQQVYENAVRGEHIDFSAPGVDVFIYNGHGGDYISGTSVAAPFVTALIASNASFAQQRKADALRTAIGGNAVDLGVVGPDPIFGVGLIRAQLCQSDSV